MLKHMTYLYAMIALTPGMMYSNAGLLVNLQQAIDVLNKAKPKINTLKKELCKHYEHDGIKALINQLNPMMEKFIEEERSLNIESLTTEYETQRHFPEASTKEGILLDRLEKRRKILHTAVLILETLFECDPATIPDEEIKNMQMIAAEALRATNISGLLNAIAALHTTTRSGTPLLITDDFLDQYAVTIEALLDPNYSKKITLKNGSQLTISLDKILLPSGTYPTWEPDEVAEKYQKFELLTIQQQAVQCKSSKQPRTRYVYTLSKSLQEILKEIYENHIAKGRFGDIRQLQFLSSNRENHPQRWYDELMTPKK